MSKDNKSFEFRDGANDTIKVSTTLNNTLLEILFIEEPITAEATMFLDKSHIGKFKKIIQMLEELDS